MRFNSCAGGAGVFFSAGLQVEAGYVPVTHSSEMTSLLLTTTWVLFHNAAIFIKPSLTGRG